MGLAADPPVPFKAELAFVRVPSMFDSLEVKVLFTT